MAPDLSPEPARLGTRPNRVALHALDACLQEMEDANERGEVRVSPRLARRLERYAPWLRHGMLLSDAIEGVFAQQERYLSVREPGRAPWSVDGAGKPNVEGPPEPITRAEARSLTERIKTGTQLVCLLLLEAHRRRAWLALGYGTWGQYVREEFGLSKSRAYELLDQGNVVRTIQAAVGMSGVPNVSAYAAGEIKPVLSEVIDEIRLRAMAENSQERVNEIVTEVVRIKRRELSRTRAGASRPEMPADPALLGPSEPAEAAHWARGLRDVIAFLASLPPPAVVVQELARSDADRLPGLAGAAHWLTDFASRCNGSPG